MTRPDISSFPTPWQLGEAHESMCEVWDASGKWIFTIKASSMVGQPAPEDIAERFIMFVNRASLLDT